MISVLLVDDHSLFRSGLKLVLGRSPDICVVAEAASYADTIECLRDHVVAVAIVDLSIPGRDGLDLISYIRSAWPTVAVLVISMHNEEEYAVRALRVGAMGYLTKDSTDEQVLAAVKQVARGGSYICPRLAGSLALRFGRRDGAALPHTMLSDREFQIFEMLVRGDSVGGIARELSLSAKTVSTHKVNLLHKMSMRSESELVRYAIKHRLDRP